MQDNSLNHYRYVALLGKDHVCFRPRSVMFRIGTIQWEGILHWSSSVNRQDPRNISMEKGEFFRPASKRSDEKMRQLKRHFSGQRSRYRCHLFYSKFVVRVDGHLAKISFFLLQTDEFRSLIPPQKTDCISIKFQIMNSRVHNLVSSLNQELENMSFILPYFPT